MRSLGRMAALSNVPPPDRSGTSGVAGDFVGRLSSIGSAVSIVYSFFLSLYIIYIYIHIGLVFQKN